MNKITHDGKEYEVLPLDRIGEITHAKLAGGKVVAADESGLIKIETAYSDMALAPEELSDFGIQPIKLLPKVPVEFVATFAFTGAYWYPLHCMDDGLAMQGKLTAKFKCVEVTE